MALNLTDSHRISLNLTKPHRISPNFIEPHQISPDLAESPRTSPNRSAVTRVMPWLQCGAAGAATGTAGALGGCSVWARTRRELGAGGVPPPHPGVRCLRGWVLRPPGNGGHPAMAPRARGFCSAHTMSPAVPPREPPEPLSAAPGPCPGAMSLLGLSSPCRGGELGMGGAQHLPAAPSTCKAAE